MNKPVIAVDFDDVLTPHHVGLLAWYNKSYGTKLTIANYHGLEPGPWGVRTDSEAILRVQKYFDSTEFKSEQPYDAAGEVLRQLADRYSLIVVTGRDHMIEEATKEWLTEHHPGLFVSIHFTAQYNLEGKSRSKADLVHSERIEYLIEDSLTNLKEVVAVGAKGVLFGDYPWNQTDSLPSGIVRCKDWQAVQEYFDGIA